MFLRLKRYKYHIGCLLTSFRLHKTLLRGIASLVDLGDTDLELQHVPLGSGLVGSGLLCSGVFGSGLLLSDLEDKSSFFLKRNIMNIKLV